MIRLEFDSRIEDDTGDNDGRDMDVIVVCDDEANLIEVRDGLDDRVLRVLDSWREVLSRRCQAHVDDWIAEGKPQWWHE